MKNDKMTENTATVQGRAGSQKQSTKTKWSDIAIILCLNSIKRTPLSRISKVKGMGSQIFSSFK